MENPQMQNDAPAKSIDAVADKKSKRTVWIVGGGVLLLVAAAVAVLVVTQSQANQQTASSFPRLNGGFGQGGDQGLEGQFGGFGGPGNFQMTPAPELPTTPADLTGSVAQINGQSIMVSQRNGRGFRPGATPDAAQAASTPLPDVEVIVTGSTVIYKDTTQRPDFQNGQPPSGPVTIQQQVTASSLGEIPANSRVTVWGDRNGNQITAKVIVYSQLVPRQQPNNGGNSTG